MKPSEITPDEVIKYARMDDMDADLSPEALLAAAKAFVKSYTGLTDEELDKHEEISIAILALCADMYDNRQSTVENDKVNRVVETILGLHSVNLL
ncbi:head-tail connector protein [Anaerotruncus rubiinfantis]|uniref:head-tail connector protein n=1 Tax=Anaerotruncus rubiinfantis TaxID=1720200 RepID=UPI00082B2BB8|nr:head-tail connector protein [Anaerotruncus rubiinfantis]